MPNIVTVTANRERLIPDVINAGTRGSLGQTRLAFQFSDYWDGMTISIVFYPIRGNPVRVPYLPGGIIDVPNEIMKYNGETKYVISGAVVSGNEISNRSISLTGRIRVAYTAGGTTGNTRKITADTYDLFLTQAKDYIDRLVGTGDGGDTAEAHPYLSLERLRSYLFRVTFGEIPEYNGADAFSPAGCTSFVQNGKLYSNLDWDYGEAADFIVVCNGFMGTAFLPDLTDDSLDDDRIAQLPYHIRDGRNESGIMVAEHILYNDWNWVGSGSTPLSMVPYWILTHVRSMTNFPAQVSPILSDLYANPSLVETDYLAQYIITDGTTTYCLMPPTASSGAYQCVDITTNPKLANFRWVSNQTVSRGDLQNRPTGVERWNAIPASLEDLRFSLAYESPDRLSEFIGINGTTKYSSDAALTAIYNSANALYQNRERNGELWHTMHSVVYSSAGMEDLWVQEDYSVNYGNAAAVGESGEGAEEGSGNTGFVIVTTLPNNPSPNVLYLLTGESSYTVYVYDSDGWHQISGEGGSGIWYSESEDDEPPEGYDIWIIGGEGETGIPIPDVTVERVSGGVKIAADSGSGVTEATVHDGENFAIKGYYDTFAELSSAVPNPTVGDVYGVGEEETFDLYVWDAVGEMWRNNGSIAGVPGADGQDGISPTITASKSNGVTTLTITDKNGTRTATINDGQNGSPGSTPVKGTDYWTAADKAEIVQDVLNALPEWTGGSY